MTSWWCEYAWLPTGPAARTRIVADPGGSITAVEPEVDPQPADVRLEGLVLPGMANAHSHAFHRALRGRTHTVGSSFAGWRERMYSLAARLDPDTYCELATAVYAEMALAGITCVGEFHYLHHSVGGARYGDPNAMGEAMREAARRVGIRLTLLDAVYVTGGIGVPLEGVQRRFDDGDAEGWASRVSMLAEDDGFRIGAAVHSVRAVPADQLPDIIAATERDDDVNRPLHIHLSELPSENAACLAAYGITPTRLFAEYGALGPSTTAVHATHMTADDVTTIGRSGTTICACPSTEGDLGDGIGPIRSMADAGCPVALGTDQHALVDLLEEARLLEMHERLANRQRVRFSVPQLVTALTEAGHASLGWPEAGRLAVGAPADLVAVRMDTVRTVGTVPAQTVVAANASDIHTVVANGRVIAETGRHALLGDVAHLLGKAITNAWS